jgi:hypothetical protein
MSRTRLAAFVLVGLGVLALILSGLAVLASRGEPSGVDPLAAKDAQTRAPRSQPSTAPPATRTTASPAVATTGVAPELPVAMAADGRTILVGATGECRGQRGGPVSRSRLTTDGGRTWSSGAIPLARIDRVITGANTSNEVQRFLAYGAEPADCSLGVVGAGIGTTSTTLTWRAGSGGQSPLFRIAYVRGEIRTDSGAVTVPCTVRLVDVEGSGSGDSREVWVLCVDGTVAQSPDGGATWTKRTAADDAVALAVAPGGDVYIVQRGSSTSECPSGATLASWDGTAWETGACIAVGTSDSVPEGFAGSALSFGTDDDAIAVIDGRAAVTTDAGSNWQPASAF